MIIVIEKTTLYELWPSLQNSARFDPVFTSLDFATIHFLKDKAASLAPNRQPGGPGPVFKSPSHIPRHQVPFPLPSTTHRATI
jgi:hypothetical protein